MIRFALYFVILILLSRALSRLWGGVMAGLRGGHQPNASRVPERGVHMARDPVCGTFVVPERAVTLAIGRHQVHFCSDACRDKYRARPSAYSGDAGRPEPVEGRTA
jgi:YHS domain-containing protein